MGPHVPFGIEDLVEEAVALVGREQATGRGAGASVAGHRANLATGTWAVSEPRPRSQNVHRPPLASPAMSTRKLIFLALLCGLALIVAFAAQLLVAR